MRLLFVIEHVLTIEGRETVVVGNRIDRESARIGKADVSLGNELWLAKKTA